MTHKQTEKAPLTVTLFSFGFKHGHPLTDLMWDVRFLPNPYWDPVLKNHSGLEKPVADYVLQNQQATDFLNLFEAMLEYHVTQYHLNKKDTISLAIGCTGGKHRSVAVTQHIANFLANIEHIQLNTFHRDIDKE